MTKWPTIGCFPNTNFYAQTAYISPQMTSSSIEILLVSSSDGLITAYDASTGVILAHFTSSWSPRKGLTVTGNNNNLIVASHIISDTADAGAIHLYNWWSPVPFKQLHLPEVVAPLAATPDGLYIFCGGVSGYIHGLRIPSGELLLSVKAHCQTVTCLAVNDDVSLLISGGDDGTICIFSLMQLLDTTCSDANSRSPLYQFNAHLGSLMGITVGMNGIIISCSSDCTCILWNLAYGSYNVRTISFPCMVSGFTMDPSETNFYAGGSDGKIYAGVLKVGSRELLDTNVKGVMVWSPDHGSAVTSVAVTNNGANLVSASEDGNVRIWDTISGQLLKVFRHDRGSISNIVTAKVVEDCGGNEVECEGHDLGHSDREIVKPVREVAQMEEVLGIVMKDRRRALDRLDTSIGTYEKLLGLILKEAQGEGCSTSSNLDDSNDQGAET